MEITTEDLGVQNKSLKIKIKPEDYKAKVQSGLKEKQRNVMIPGFRKGNVPFDYIKKYYAKSLLFDEITKLVPETINGYLEENKLNIIGKVVPTKENYDIGENWNLDTEFDFEYELGLAPEIDIEQPFDEVINQYVVDVTESMIDSEVTSFLRRYSKYSKADATRENDYTFGEIIELDENLNPKENGVVNKTIFALDLIPDTEERSKFIGLKIEDEVVFDLVKAINNESEISHLLNIKKDDIKNLTSKFKFIVKEITRQEKPELSQENFDKWFGEGQINGLEEFRQYLKYKILDQYISYSNDQLFFDFKEYLLNKLNPFIPLDFIKRLLLSYDIEKWNEETIDKSLDEISKSYQWTFIERAFVEKYELSVSKEERNQLAYQIIIERMQEQRAEMTDENYKKYSKDMFSNADTIDSLNETIIQQKLFKKFSEVFKVDVIPLPIDVFATKITYQNNRY